MNDFDPYYYYRIVEGLCCLCWHKRKSRSTEVKEGPKDIELVSNLEHGKPHSLLPAGFSYYFLKADRGRL